MNLLHVHNSVALYLAGEDRACAMLLEGMTLEELELALGSLRQAEHERARRQSRELQHAGVGSEAGA